MFKKLKMLFAGLAVFSTVASVTAVQAEADKSQELVVYSNAVSSGRGDWLIEKAAEAGFKIKIVEVPGGEIADRLIGEKNNSIADVTFGLNVIEYNKLKKEDVLKPYKPAWADEVTEGLADPDGNYWPITVVPLVLMGNESQTMPKDWTDLTDPKYKDQYGIFALSGGTPKMILASILARYADKDGELGVSEEGWEVVKKYIQNAHIYTEGEDHRTAIIEGKYKYGQMWGNGLLQLEKERNVKMQFMQPEIGMPFVSEHLGIVKNSKKTQLAEEFINWFGSAETQLAWSNQFGTIPANKKALEKAPDYVKEFASKTKQQDIDWEFVGQHIDQWVEKVTLEFIQ